MKTRILLVMMMLFAGSVFSQTATPESRASAERLLQVLKLGENFDNTIRQAVTMQMGMLDKRMDIPAEKKETVRKSIEAAVNSSLEKMSWQKMKGMFVDIYAEVFTKEELDGVIAFYESPAGQKFVAKQPQLTQVTMQKMQTLISEMMPELQKEIAAAVRSPDVAKARNIADVEKAKGRLTLPVGKVVGAMGADASTNISSGEGLTNLLAALKISDISALTVDGEAINLGDMKTKASY
jgi:hypothetical protein